MDKCFVVCGCDDLEGVTKSDLDRFTDKIENVLNDEKGRRLFRNFMFTCNMKDGRRVLDFWENIERLLNHTENAESTSFSSYLRDYYRLTDAIEEEEVLELDFATMERMMIARDSENKEEIEEALKVLKVEATKALRTEYSRFREKFIPSKSNK